MAVLFAWLEYRRANKRFLLLRIGAALVAVAALGCIVLPIKYNSTITKSIQHKNILLTQGFNADSLPDGIDTSLITLDASIKKAYPKVKLISGLDELSKTAPLHVYGNGLSKDELVQLDSLPVILHAAKIPAGVSNISWNDQLKAGEVLRVQGVYNNTSAQKVKLVLRGLSTGLDSIILPPNAQTPFGLSTTPKATGKMVFTLNADTALQGSLPVQIQPVKPLKVLMLSASPDFESKFLKNWLSENGYSVALRSAISKGKYNSGYINIAQFNLDKLSAQTLAQFDVVIGDLSVLSTLSSTESDVLKQAVANKGMGLIVRADSAGKTSWLQKQFPVDRPSGKEPEPASLIINGNKSGSGKLAYGPAYIVYQDGTQPLVKTKERILAGLALYGSGKIVFTTLNNTFSWMLGGNKQDYTELWSVLLSKAARKNDEVKNYIQFSSLPVSNEPVVLQVSQGSSSPIVVNNELIAPAQNADIPFEWNASYRPSNAGWQNLKQGDKISTWYAYPQNEWKPLRSAEKTAATTQYAALHPNRHIVTKQIQQKVRIDVPKIYFYILLLAACTFLWIETKIS
ncbi:hypothetical protein IDJ75_12035 [Mucilaginibacter rigui]|uniref:Uncharacterized protein n=1 Tax=Mucilaginibacter rigui TaxID=534635 RepID=A0ABR7X5Z6_9SPHI|nr:hypothetical protein [Mucilaginibacter rigui]MBD1386013.1 hypothetical protein [Mucilaginibacter rigui]